MNDCDLLRYSRHILLPQIDLAGQERWSSSKILVVGCGGLGSAALPLLAAAGVGQGLMVDDDVVDLSNLQRQLVYDTQDIGCLKAIAMQNHLQALNPQVQYRAITERVDEARLFELAQGVDMILDCSDNFATRYAINRVAFGHRIPLVSAAAIRFAGQVAVYDFRQPESACYACVFPDAQGDDGACSVSGVFSPLVAMMGAFQAAECLKILAQLDNTAHQQLHCYDALHNRWQTLTIEKNADCPVCACH